MDVLNNLTIRLARPSDLKGIIRVMLDTAKSPMVSILTPQELLEKGKELGMYLEYWDDPDFIWHAMVALLDNEIVGVTDFLTTDNLRRSHVAEIGIGILDGFRGKGIGSQLIAKSEEYLKEQGIKKLRLLVYELNERARRFYKKLGFQDMGRYSKEIRLDNGDFVDLIIMEKWLD